MSSLEPDGSRLRTLRESAGLSLRDVADHVDASYSYIGRIERDQVTPSEPLLRQLASLYDVDGDRLVIAFGHIPTMLQSALRGHPERLLLLCRYVRRHNAPPDLSELL